MTNKSKREMLNQVQHDEHTHPLTPSVAGREKSTVACRSFYSLSL